MKALVVVNCFPPLLKNAGGVSKRYLTLCRALIDGLGWQVTLVTPVNVRCSAEPDVLRWLHEGRLVHLPARGVRIHSKADGVAVFLDLFSAVNMSLLMRELCIKRDYDCVFMDDIAWRFELLFLTRATGVATVVSTHTDITHMPSCKGVVALVWKLHVMSAHLASVHATVSQVFGNQMAKTYHVPVNAVWPPILWSPEFRSEPSAWTERAAAQRRSWLDKLREQGCSDPKAIMLFAGRWSAEKRIHLLWESVPKDCALVICGDSTSDYADRVSKAGSESGRNNVLPLRKMLNAPELRLAYAAADLFISASNFETLGNTVIEAFCSGTPVAVQPAQGHLEFVKEGQNSWFVDFSDVDEARAMLSRIVASGLDEKSLARVIPEFAALGKSIRDADFAKEFDKAVAQKALEIAKRKSIFGGEVNALVEVIKRILCISIFVVVWFILRVGTRFVFVTSKDPSFAVLGQLGSAVDDGNSGVVFTWPCMRLLFGCDTQVNGSLSPTDRSDYESHYKAAVQQEMRKWFKPKHELVLMILTVVCLFTGCVPFIPFFRGFSGIAGMAA